MAFSSVGKTLMGFVAPWLLLGLLSLPVLWWLLRATPPKPLRVKFPAVVLMLGLKDPDTTPDRTPWWLLLLRLFAIACLIVGFASPLLRSADQSSDAPLVIAMDASWASAQSWNARVEKVGNILKGAEQNARPVTVLLLTSTPIQGGIPFTTAPEALSKLAGMTPAAWPALHEKWNTYFGQTTEAFDIIWVSDGLTSTHRQTLFSTFASKGNIRVIEDAQVLALSKPSLTDDGLEVSIQRLGDQTRYVNVSLIGADPTGVLRNLLTQKVTLESDSESVQFDVPFELRNRVQRIELDGVASAGAVQLVGSSLQKRKVALIETRNTQEAALLTSPLHFLRQALIDTAQIVEGSLESLLVSNPDVIVLADGPANPALEDWVREGGTLVRFAGPKLAKLDIESLEGGALLPVRLRGGGRNTSGALSWGVPKALAEFDETSPFYGLSVPKDVQVLRQVMAQPDPNLAEKVLATLTDGTPLVTADTFGEGRVVLFHVTANADWSNLPISGLFVQMLDRLAISLNGEGQQITGFEDRIWVADPVLDGFGRLTQAQLAGVQGQRLLDRDFGPDLPPGLYQTVDRRVAMNIGQSDTLKATNWSIPVESFEISSPLQLKAIFLSVGLILLAIDVLASLLMSGRLRTQAAVLLVAFFITPSADAQDDAALLGANNTVLAYVVTGNPQVDETSKAGLLGLSNVLNRRTSIEPISPVGVRLGQDELAFYALLYWPITPEQRLSQGAVEQINQFLRTGGLILFDTQDAHLGGFGSTPNGRALRKLTQGLNIPPLEPVPQDHVLTRTFYLLSDFPGRHQNTDVWVETALDQAQADEGAPFRNLNDGVTPVIIGSNDWASAWAINDQGRFMNPVGRGFAGEKQREMAFRFGINLVMYVMTGNYKSDQVHVPALLDRLGQ